MNIHRLVGKKIYIFECDTPDDTQNEDSNHNDYAIDESVIEEFEFSQMLIRIRSRELEKRPAGKVTVLVMMGDKIYNFNGRFRRGHYGMVEISLYGGNDNDNRSNRRYHVQTTAQAETETGLIQVELLNISTGGAMLRTDDRVFDDGSVLKLHMNIGEQETVITSTVVWVRLDKCDGWLYGCEFLEANSDGQ